MFALIDCNNFYASCERVFNPKLIGLPVVILSNNDGCVIARSQEAKAIGIEMGVPHFQITDIIKKYNVQVQSSNYTLYGDMSRRVMEILRLYSPNVEVYSIDESFLDLSGFPHLDLKKYGEDITRTVYQLTGIPVSMGIAPTKTLAKTANKFAKKFKAYNNVCLIDSEEKRIKALQLTQLKDVWGIGRQHRKRLNKMNVFTAYDFTQMNRAWVRKYMTVVGERMWLELLGESCIELELIPPDKKQICTSRAFGSTVTDYEDMSEAVAYYAGLCAEKLRKQRSCAVSLMVFIHTNNFREDLPQYAQNIIVEFPVPTNYTAEIVHYALEGLKKIFKTGYQYKKAGIIITEITPGNAIQTNIFDKVDREKQKRVSQLMDKLNSGFTSNVLTLAVQGTNQKWRLKQDYLSPSYTTKLKDVISIDCTF